ncbi:unnamed protein product [Camellia sinensis]
MISCNCSDAYTITLVIFNMLSSYSWEAKVVIALAAFVCVAFLNHLPDMPKHTNSLKPKFEALINLIKAMLDVTKCIVEFKELLSQYIMPDMSEMMIVIAYTPIAVYWTIRSIVECASEIMNLIGMGHKGFLPVLCSCSRCQVVSKTLNALSIEVQSINLHCSFDRYTKCLITPFKSIFKHLVSSSRLVESVSLGVEKSLYGLSYDGIKDDLNNLHLTDVDFGSDWLPSVAGQLRSVSIPISGFNRVGDDRRHKQGYFDPFHTLARLLEIVHIDNTKILKALTCAKEDQLPLIDGYTKKRVHIDVLRRKNLLLLISNVELSCEEHFFLHQLCIEAQEHPKENQYEVVWIPVMKETNNSMGRVHQ